MADIVRFKLTVRGRSDFQGANDKELLTLSLPGGSLLDEQLYPKRAVQIVVDNGFYYSVEQRRVHTELGAGAESHDIQLAIFAGAAGGVATAVVQQIAEALREVAALLGKRDALLSEGEFIHRAIECAGLVNESPSISSLEVHDDGWRVVRLQTRTNNIRVELDQLGNPRRISRRKRVRRIAKRRSP